jgi:hypothetical protein
MLPGATLYHFGVMSSSMHMAWTRQVCGRLEGRYRYSTNIVYNNFPWPVQITPAQRNRVERAAQRVIEVRAAFPDSTLADLYDPLSMPQDLVRAHNELDRVVEVCYRAKTFRTDLERLEFLFDLYLQYTQPMVAAVDAAAAPASMLPRIRKAGKKHNV